MKTKILFLLTLIIGLASCAVKNADETAMFFYDMVKISDFESAVTVIDPESLTHTPAQVWKDGLIQKQQRMGNLLSYQRTDYYTDTIDNVTRVSITYDVKYSEGILKEKLQFILRNGKYFITFYEFKEADN